jgi:phosphoribosylformylglycinamidine cyclo-ligase
MNSNNEKQNKAYKDAGVDIFAGYESTNLIKEKLSKAKSNENVLGGLGGFASFYNFDKNAYDEPVLVSCTDGVGTKLKLAFLLNKHDTIGQDLVAMSVNDLVCVGAKPLFFLDYVATSKNKPAVIAEIVGGIVDALDKVNCPLVGGETAEMPGFYKTDEYDLAGFCVGVAEKSKIPTPTNVKKGDAIVGFASSGVHSNGFSLLRKAFAIDSLTPADVDKNRDFLLDLLTPTELYVNLMLDIFSKCDVHGISNITGGGFFENIPRALPKDLTFQIDKGSFPIPDVFRKIQEKANVTKKDMFNTFNMGIGMIGVFDQSEVQKVLAISKAHNINAYTIGSIIGQLN